MAMERTAERSIGVGVLGLGTVGTGVVQGILQRGDLIRERTDLALELRGVADLDTERDRGIDLDPRLLTDNAEAVIDDPAVDVVVELIGGIAAARSLILRALEKGKPVVTANKALLATFGAELFAAARANRTGLFFEASVAGGIPIIRALQDGLVASRFDRIYGILNGTCNYILTQIEAEGASFDDVLAEAQRAGYAEADAALDIDGHDTAHKTCILATLAHGGAVALADVPVRGIRGISPLDIAYARELGYRIKLLSVVRCAGDELEASVHPALVPLDHMIASVGGVFNAVLVSGDLSGDTLYYGRGAGRDPTAGAVLADIADAASRLLTNGPWSTACYSAERKTRMRDPGQIRSRHYLRLSLQDRPGILARVARVLGDHDISIASVMQKESAKGAPVPVILLTHEAAGRNMDEAIRQIDAMDCVGAASVQYRIEDFIAAGI